MVTAERYHDISCGHRVVNHESKCKHLHGHNYRFHFVVQAQQLDSIGRVIDFSVIKSTLCEYIEQVFDHKMLIWVHDPLLPELKKIIKDDIVEVPFNPTAENLAKFMVEEIAPVVLFNTPCTLIECRVEETRKCSATYKI